MQTQETPMRYFTRQNEANANVVDFLGPRGQTFGDEAGLESADKWPFWWTAVGLTLFCGLFWTALFRLLF